jgi:hypothetical protein
MSESLRRRGVPWYLSPLANKQRPAPCFLPCAHCPWYLSALLLTIRPKPWGTPFSNLPVYLSPFSNLAFPAYQHECDSSHS